MFPSNLQMSFYPQYGEIVLYDDDTTKAILWKDLQTSAISANDPLVPVTLNEDEGSEDIIEDNKDEAEEI